MIGVHQETEAKGRKTFKEGTLDHFRCYSVLK